MQLERLRRPAVDGPPGDGRLLVEDLCDELLDLRRPLLVVEGKHARLGLDAVGPAQASPQDLAKDVAAMSLEGGVIVIGVEERAGEATAVVPFPLAGRVEQIQQIIDARVRPTLSVRIEALRRRPGDADGVVVITIAPSRQAPHMVGDRYPARSGATTRCYSELEVAELYRRREALKEAASALSGLDDFVIPPDGAMRRHKALAASDCASGP